MMSFQGSHISLCLEVAGQSKEPVAIKALIPKVRALSPSLRARDHGHESAEFQGCQGYSSTSAREEPGPRHWVLPHCLDGPWSSGHCREMRAGGRLPLGEGKRCGQSWSLPHSVLLGKAVLPAKSLQVVNGGPQGPHSAPSQR